MSQYQIISFGRSIMDDLNIVLGSFVKIGKIIRWTATKRIDFFHIVEYKNLPPRKDKKSLVSRFPVYIFRPLRTVFHFCAVFDVLFCSPLLSTIIVTFQSFCNGKRKRFYGKLDYFSKKDKTEHMASRRMKNLE